MLSALRHHRRLVFVFFLLAAAFLYFAHIDSYHLIELDEGRYHRIPMEMVLSGDYLTPHSITCPTLKNRSSSIG